MTDFQIRMQIDADDMQNIFGENDAYIRKIEDDLKVVITDRNGAVTISGGQSAVQKAARLVDELVEFSKRGNTIQEQNVTYALELSKEGDDEALLEIDSECICHTIAGKPIKPKTLGQKKYIEAIKDKMIVFGLGPAGTGKTLLAQTLAKILKVPFSILTCSLGEEQAEIKNDTIKLSIINTLLLLLFIFIQIIS